MKFLGGLRAELAVLYFRRANATQGERESMLCCTGSYK
jgi:hypothetical protein